MTDTSRSGDLVGRLRDLAAKFEGQGGKHYTAALFGECADRIEALEAENERLREVLRGVTPPAHFGESAQSKAWWAKARAALGVDTV